MFVSPNIIILEGVSRLGSVWVIPRKAIKPKDARAVTGRYKK